MNVGAITDMIRQDPAITKDIKGFIEKMNAKTIKQVESVKTIIEDAITYSSIAERNGGDATEDDVNAAIAQLQSEPLIEEAQQRYQNVVAAISSGDAQSGDDIVAAFSVAIPAPADPAPDAGAA